MRIPASRLDANNNVIVKDGLGRDIQLTDGGSLNSGNGSLGGYIKALTYIAGSPYTITSATFADITGMVDQTIVTPVSGDHILTISGGCWSSGGSEDMTLRLMIDGNPYEYPAIIESTNSYVQDFSQTIIVSLSAGSHTVRPQAKILNARTMNVQGAWTLLAQAQGTGINGLEVVESTLATQFSITSIYSDIPGANMAQVSTVQCVVNTLENEQVQVSFSGSLGSSGFCDAAIGYQVDSNTPVVCEYCHANGNGFGFAVAFTKMTAPLTAGQHTIKLMAAGGDTNSYFRTGNITSNDKFQVTRFKSFGIGAGTIVTNGTLATGDQTISSGTLADTGDYVVVNTIENERVLLTLNKLGSYSAGTGTTRIGYKIDSESGVEVIMGYFPNDGSYGYIPIGMSVLTPPLTAGQHTITIQAAKLATGSNWIYRGTAATNWGSFTATQYRGGLIPIQDDGLTIVEKPSAIDFAGAGVTVTQTGTKALVTIPGGGGGGGTTFLALTDTPDSYTSQGNKLVAVNSGATALEFISPPASNFLALTDTPSSYSGQGGKLVAVNSGASALEFISAPASNFLALTDTPDSYAGQAGKIPRVNDAANALEFVVQPNGALGGFSTILDFIPTGATTITSATYADIAGVVNQTFTTPVSGTHIIKAFTQTYVSAAGWRDIQFRAIIDEVITVEFKGIEIIYPTTTAVFNVLQEGQTALSAGSHTIRLQAKMTGGSGGAATVWFNPSWTVGIQAQGSGINGLEVVESSLASDFTVTQVYINQVGGNMAQVSTVQCVINTLESERVQIEFNATIAATVSDDIIYGYQVDSATPVVCGYAGSGDNESVALSFSRMSDPLAAGQHTIKLMASKARTNGSTIKGSSSGGAWNPKFQVTRFKSVGIGTGTIITSAALGADFTVTSEIPTPQDVTGLSVTINTIEGEYIGLSYNGDSYTSSGAGYTQMYYKVDSGSDILLSYSGAISMCNMSASITIGPLTAGSHTIKIRAAKQTVTPTYAPILQKASTFAGLQITQYRGGLIPIQQEGITKVEKPSFQNYKGGAIVTANGTGADITFPNAALGGYTKLLDFTPTALTAITSATYADIAGIVDQTFVTPASGIHEFDVFTQTYQPVTGGAAGRQKQLQLLIDGVTAVPLKEEYISTDGTVNPVFSTTQKVIATLTAGSHTVRIQGKMNGGSGSNLTAWGVWTVGIQAQGTGINGLEVLRDGLSSDFTVTQEWGSGTVQDSGYELTINALEGECVQLGLTTTVFNTTSGTGILAVTYQIDSDAFIRVMDVGVLETYTEHPVVFTAMTAPLSAGSHTIKIRLAKVTIGGTFTPVIYSYTPGFQITRFKTLDTSWKAFTPTGSWTTNTTYTGFYRQIGDTLECRVQVALSGAPNSATLTVNLPSGFTIDTTKILSTGGFEEIFGQASCLDGGISQYRAVQVTYNNTTSVAPLCPNGTTTVAPLNQATPFTFGNTDKVWLNFSVPVT